MLRGLAEFCLLSCLRLLDVKGFKAPLGQQNTVYSCPKTVSKLSFSHGVGEKKCSTSFGNSCSAVK